MSANLAGSYRLTADVDCTGFDAGDGHGFEPLGDRDDGSFTGSFDGNGHMITGLTIARPFRRDVGLFGATDGAVIEKVGLIGANVQGSQSVGTLVGFAAGTALRKAYATGTAAGANDVGGISGELDPNSTMRDCYAAVTIEADRDHGLLVGWVAGLIEHSYAYGAAPAKLGSVYDGSIAASFFDCDMAGDCSEQGATSTAAMSAPSTYTSAGWDFDATWGFLGTTGYPCLRWQNGCGCVPGLDGDGDGISDCTDGCLADPSKSAPGVCGCGRPDVDSDADGPLDCNDPCPLDSTKVQPGICGCNEPDVDADGDGLLNCNDPDSPQAIRDCAELQAVRDDLAGNYRMVLDVDCTGFTASDGDGFEPLGSRDDGAFTGHLDGNSHVISGLRIARGYRRDVGLFGATQGALIERVGLIEVDVEGSNSVGALVGNAGDTIIRESYATGVVTGWVDTGGLVGEINAGTAVVDCYANAAAIGEYDIGLLVGWTDGTIERSYASGDRPPQLGSLRAGSLVASFYDCDEAGDCAAAGATSTAAMSERDTFTSAGWDFENTWNMGPFDYPCLRWQKDCRCVPGRDTDGNGVVDCADPDLLGYWGFNESSGNVALDTSGHGVSATIINATRTSAGRSGGALYFNGTSSRVAIPVGTWNVGTPVTYSVWYKADGSPTGHVFGHRLTSAVTGAFAFSPREFSGASYDSIRFAAYDSTGTGRGLPFRGPSSPGVWTMVTVSISASEMRLYKNGALLGSSPISGGLPAIAGPLYIGARGEVPDLFFKGWIDEFAVYGRAMSDLEVAALYNAYEPAPPTPWFAHGLVGRWTFDEGSGAVAADASGYGNSGTLLGATAWDANCVAGSCLRFDGTSSRVRIPDGVWNQTGHVTYIVWYKNDPSSAGRFLMEHEFGSNIRGAFYLRSDHPGFGAYDSTQTSRPVAPPYSYPSPPPNEWRMLAVVFTPSEARVYSNGTLVGTSALAGGGVPYYPGSLYLGARGSVPDNYFRGWIDEVSIYARSLSEAEIGGLYDATLASAYTGCDDDTDCPSPSVCAFGVSHLYGRSPGQGVCRDPRDCATLESASCGAPNSRCGLICCDPLCGAEVGISDGCGGTCAPCVSSADSDADGLTDCEERQDGDAWTDALVFNGVEATRGNACHASPTCAQIDTLDEVHACLAPLERTNLHSGWAFFTDQRPACSAGYGFDLNWQGCSSNFAIHAEGTIRFAEGGMQCFAVDGSTAQQCGALYLDGTPMGTSGDRQCLDLPAGVYPIEWFYETTSQSAPNHLRISYCHGGDDECAPSEALPASMLRVGSDRESRVCDESADCTDLCPCGHGRVCFGDSTCAEGLECRLGFAQYFGHPEDAAVCWDPACDYRGSADYQCGSVGSQCGLCNGCQPDCSGKACGSDGCNGRCGLLCGAGEAGCETDVDCEAGLVCGVDNGARFGRPESHRVCWPPICQALDQSDVQCGTTADPCGTCPACIPNCNERSCGSNGCGGSCGECPAGATCQESTGSCYAQLIRRFPLPADVTVPPTEPVGTLDGRFDVSASGEATYTVPLTTPPGRGGIEPSLALAYNSARGNGHVGLGWAVEGLSAIIRCDKTIAQDGAASAPTFGETFIYDQDAFCLDGQRLVYLGWALDGTERLTFSYLTEDNRFTRVYATFDISRIVTATEEVFIEGPRSFTAWAKDGRIFEYGAADNSRIRQAVPFSTDGGTPTAPVQTWALSDVKDRTGFNQMHVQYVHRFQQTAGGYVREYYPQHIAYGPYQNPIVVRFLYSSDVSETRSDPRSAWRYGVNLQTNELLREVVVEIESVATQRYLLGYHTPESQGGTHSRLATIERCTGDSHCMPPTTFEYRMPDLRLRPARELLPDVSIGNRNATVLDMNGDGIDDVLFEGLAVSDDGLFSVYRRYDWWVAMSKRNENGQVVYDLVKSGIPISENAQELFDTDVGDYHGSPSGLVIDFDNDGRQDFLETRFRKDGHTPDYAVLVYDGVQVQRLFTGIPAKEGSPSDEYLIDVNGDHFDDLLICEQKSEGPRWRLYRHRGGESGETLSTGNRGGLYEVNREDLAIDAPCARGALPIDREGDGAEELLLPTNKDGTGPALWLGFGADGVPGFGFTNATFGEGTFTMDVNGDGLRDVVRIQDDALKTHWDVVIQINRGNGYFEFNHVLRSKTGDFETLKQSRFPFDANGDGRDDLILNPQSYGGPGGSWFAWLSTGQGFAGTFALGGGTPGAWAKLMIADTDGDGVPGIFAGSGVALSPIADMRERTGPARERLATITDGLGARTFVEYGSLSDPTVHTPALFTSAGEARCTYPLRCAPAKGVVVSQVTEYDAPHALAPDPARRFHYNYTGARADALGRGSLGFKTIDWSQEDLVNGGSTRSRTVIYQNDRREDDLGAYPYAFKASHIKTSTNVDGIDHVTDTETTWEVERVPSSFRPSSFSVFPRITTDDRFTNDPISEEFVSLGTTTNEILDRDTVGNNLRVRWSLDDGSNETRLIERTFKHQEDTTFASAWLISLPTLEVDTHTVESPFGTKERRTEFDYDANGLVEHVTRAPDDIDSELTTSYERSLGGQPLKITQTDFAGATRTTDIGYDALSEYPKTITNALGHEVEVEYDRAFGILTAMRDPNQLVTLHASDGFGRPAVEVDPIGIITRTTWGYESEQRPLTIERAREGGERERHALDVRGRVRERKTWGVNGKELVEAVTYDRNGRVETRSRPTDVALPPAPGLAYTYDNLGRILTETIAGTETAHSCYDARTQCVTNPRTFTRCTVRDYKGRIEKVLDPVAAACEDALVSAPNRIGTTYTYGPFDDLLGVRDQVGNLTEVATDNWGHKYYISDPDTGVTFHGHNGFGETRFSANANGRTEFEYDDLGRLILRREVDLNGAGQHAITSWTWDGGESADALAGELIGYLTEKQSPDGIIQRRVYDPVSGLLARTVDEIDGASYELELIRDGFGRVEEIRYPAIPELSRVAVTNTYDAYGNLTRVGPTGSSQAYWAALDTNADGQPSFEGFGDGTWSGRAYDDHGRVESEATGFLLGSIEPLQATEYDYDPNGNLDSRDDLVNGNYEFFSYDMRDRLSFDNLGASIIEYDDIGNITIGSETRYDRPQPHAIGFDGEFEYLYDGIGNRTAKLTEGFVQRTSYAPFGKPTRIWNEDADGVRSNQTELLYDADQERTVKRSALGTTTYVGGLYERRAGADATVEHVHYVTNGARMIAQVTLSVGRPERTQYIHVDRLGSTTLVTNADGVAEFEFGPYGDSRTPDWFPGTATGPSSIGVLIGFTGLEHDDEHGLVNMNGRIYDPRTRQFLSPDPFVGPTQLSIGLNRYAYALGNPLRFVDPSGYQAAGAGEAAAGSDPIAIDVYYPTPAEDASEPIEVVGIRDAPAFEDLPDPGFVDTPLQAAGVEGPASPPSRSESGNEPMDLDRTYLPLFVITGQRPPPPPKTTIVQGLIITPSWRMDGYPEIAFEVTVSGAASAGKPLGSGLSFVSGTNDASGVYGTLFDPYVPFSVFLNAGLSFKLAFGEDGATYGGRDGELDLHAFTLSQSLGDGPRYYGFELNAPGLSMGGGGGYFETAATPLLTLDTMFNGVPDARPKF